MNVTMINFGAPRLGNEAFKEWTEGNLSNLATWRYVYKSDSVPRILSRRLGYVHAGHLVQLSEDRSAIYYRQVGDGIKFKGAPWTWYCKYLYYQLHIMF